MTPSLRPYQTAGVDFLSDPDRPRSFLADEAGLGKSAQLLRAAVEPVLVVAPRMVLDGGVWDDEVERWAPGLDVTTTSYRSLCASESTGKKSGSRPLPKVAPELDREWGTVIFDEAHNLKGRKTTWTDAAKKLRTDRMYMASGTPIPNFAHELFSILQILQPHKAKPGAELGAYWRWVKEWFDVWQPPWGGHKIQGLKACLVSCPSRGGCEHWEDFYRANMEGLLLRRLRDQVLTDLPPVTEQIIECPMTPAQAKLYKQLKKDFIAWTESGTELVAWNKAALTVKLAKLTTGIDVLDPAAKGSGKLDMLQEQLANRSRPTLVLCHFQDSAEAALRRCAGMKLNAALIHGQTSTGDRTKRVRAFQSGELDVLIGTLDTLSEGVTLVAADMVIFLERSYRPSRNEQGLRRVHRLGQTRPVTAVYLHSRGTLDSRITTILGSKTDEQVAALRPAEIASLL
jgi:SNF2 family DNA or RNA helicase